VYCDNTQLCDWYAYSKASNLQICNSRLWRLSLKPCYCYSAAVSKNRHLTRHPLRALRSPKLRSSTTRQQTLRLPRGQRYAIAISGPVSLSSLKLCSGLRSFKGKGKIVAAMSSTSSSRPSSPRPRKSNLYGFNPFPSSALVKPSLSFFRATTGLQIITKTVAIILSDIPMVSPYTRESILTPEALHSQAEDLANRTENPPGFKIYDCIGGWYCTLLRPLFPTAIWLVRYSCQYCFGHSSSLPDLDPDMNPRQNLFTILCPASVISAFCAFWMARRGVYLSSWTFTRWIHAGWNTPLSPTHGATLFALISDENCGLQPLT
jgi:hypothetical protein